MPKGFLVGLGVLLIFTIVGSSLLVNHKDSPTPAPKVQQTWNPKVDAQTFDPFSEEISVEIEEVEDGIKITAEGYCVTSGDTANNKNNIICYRKPVVAYLKEYNPIYWKGISVGRYFVVPVNPFSMFIPITEDMVP